MSEIILGTPNFTGVWRLVPEQSRLPGAPVKKMVVRINHVEPDFVQAADVEYADGRVVVRTFVGRSNGEPFANTMGEVSIRSVANWMGQELVIETRVGADGARRYLRDYWSLMENGSKLKMEHRDDELAGHVGILERITE